MLDCLRKRRRGDKGSASAQRGRATTLTRGQLASRAYLESVYKGTEVVVEGSSIGGLADGHLARRIGEVLEREESVSGNFESPRVPERLQPPRRRRTFKQPPDNMHVVKRDGRREPVSFDKITRRLKMLAEEPFLGYRDGPWGPPARAVVDTDPHVTGALLRECDPVKVSQKVCSQIFDGITTRELDDLSAETAISMATLHPDYGVLASRIAVSNLHKETPKTLVQSFLALGESRLDPRIYEAVVGGGGPLAERLENRIDYRKDYQCDYFAIKTLARVYLLTDEKGKVVERPQHLYMRVALGIHGPENVDRVLETYVLMSERYYTHATPTLFNAGTRVPQMSSCFVAGTKVYTVNRGAVQIQDVVEGDLVVTHKNRVRKVVQVHDNPRGERRLYRLHVQHTPGITVTEDHRFMTFRNGADLVPQWRKASDMLRGDLLQIPAREESGEPTKLPDKEFASLVGIWYGDGGFASGSTVYVPVSAANLPLATFVKRVGRQSLGPMAVVHPDPVTSALLAFNSPSLGREFAALCDDGPKRLWHRIHGWSTQAVKSFAQGLLTCPGWPAEEEANPGLALEIYMLLRSRGVAAGFTDGRLSIPRDEFGPSEVTDCRKVLPDRMHGGASTVCKNRFVRFREAVEVSAEGHDRVYTLGVLEDHSYMVEGVTAENCYLYGIDSSMDSIEGIMDTMKKCALISKFGGGIGLHIHGVRGRGSKIRSTNGTSTGIVPMLKIFNDLARYVNQCCVPETVVYCEGGPKRIADVVEGTDSVLTRDGTFRAVKNVIVGSTDGCELLEITTPSSKTLWTKEHRVLTLRGSSETYVGAGDLVPGDALFFPIPTETVFHEAGNPDMSRFQGICIAMAHAEGDHVRIPERREFPSGKELPARNGLPADTESFLRRFLGEDGAAGAKPRNHLRMGKADLRMLLRGILEVGGDPQPEGYEILTRSDRLLGCVKFALLKLGVLPAVRASQDGTTVITVPRAPEIGNCLPDGALSEGAAPLVRDGCLITRVTGVRPVRFEGDLYDLHVEGNHNYLTDMGLVGNSGKRQGSIAVYLEPWHSDIMSFLNLKRNQGMEEERARDLFYAVWVPDLFMRRVKNDERWTLFCPTKAPRLADTYGEEFERLYAEYEEDNDRVYEVVSARDVWTAITTSQIETGVPYILFKDACNAKSNQKNLGTIKSSNLCTEIVEYSSKDECAVCNLASVSLPKYVKRNPLTEETAFDYEEMHEVVKEIVVNLNAVIDKGFYPIEEARRSNMLHRPIGVGVQGLADVFFMMGVPFESVRAREINCDIFETIYHAAVESSVEIAEAKGPYDTFAGSPASQGVLQFDMWGVTPGGRYDWGSLKDRVKASGMRNSLLVAPMPTASTAQIFGNSEGFEPATSNLYVRKTLAGEFLIVNKYLVKDLMREGIWSTELKDLIVRNKGSIQAIPGIPSAMKAVYKTAFEMRMRSIIDMAADRGAFICQSQSLNMFVANPTHSSMSSMLFYAWDKGLKTGQYYLRSLPATDPVAVTVVRQEQQQQQQQPSESCHMCSA